MKRILPFGFWVVLVCILSGCGRNADTAATENEEFPKDVIKA